MEKLTDQIMMNSLNNNEEGQGEKNEEQISLETDAVDKSQEDQIGESILSDNGEGRETSGLDQGDLETGQPEETNVESKGDVESKSFMELYERSLKTIQEGELISGEIVMIGKEHVLVDVGYKSEGQIRIDEFIDSEGNLTAKVGDKVDVLLERREDEDGRIILSKEKAAKIKIWDEIKEIYEKIIYS